MTLSSILLSSRFFSCEASRCGYYELKIDVCVSRAGAVPGCPGWIQGRRAGGGCVSACLLPFHAITSYSDLINRRCRQKSLYSLVVVDGEDALDPLSPSLGMQYDLPQDRLTIAFWFFPGTPHPLPTLSLSPALSVRCADFTKLLCLTQGTLVGTMFLIKRC